MQSILSLANSTFILSTIFFVPFSLFQCFGTANTNPPGVTGVSSQNHPSYGGARHCYNPETKNFGGNLIVGQAACDQFAQDFPCIGKNMLTSRERRTC